MKNFDQIESLIIIFINNLNIENIEIFISIIIFLINIQIISFKYNFEIRIIYKSRNILNFNIIDIIFIHNLNDLIREI